MMSIMFFLSKLLNSLPEFSYFFLPLIPASLGVFLSQFLLSKFILKLKIAPLKLFILSLINVLIFLGWVGSLFIPNFYDYSLGKLVDLVFEFVRRIFGDNGFSNFITIFIVFWPLSFIISYFYLRITKSKTITKIPLRYSFQAFLVSIVGGLSFILIGLGMIIGMFKLNDVCEGKRLNLFAEFHGHITNVCVRENKNECPRNESQLRAFNPRKFDELQRCTTARYQFDEETQQYHWSMKHSGSYIEYGFK